MNDRRRLHREDPVRTGPVRDWSTLYRRSDSWGTGNPAASPESMNHGASNHGAGNHSTDDVVTRGVELGYRVIEEYLRQGQRVAQQINGQSYSIGRAGADLQELVERVFRDSTDLLSLWVGFVSSLAANPEFTRAFSRAGQPSPFESPQRGTSAYAASSNGGPPHQGTVVSIEIVSSGSIQVTLDLYPQSAGLPLVTPGLHALNGQTPPLTDITFEPGSESGVPRLRVRVPEGQSPGVYTGVVVDRNTGLPRGTLSVRVSD
jgi:hypothetical protein